MATVSVQASSPMEIEPYSAPALREKSELYKIFVSAMKHSVEPNMYDAGAFGWPLPTLSDENMAPPSEIGSSHAKKHATEESSSHLSKRLKKESDSKKSVDEDPLDVEAPLKEPVPKRLLHVDWKWDDGERFAFTSSVPIQLGPQK
jgi:hypothetical protein